VVYDIIKVSSTLLLFVMKVYAYLFTNI